MNYSEIMVRYGELSTKGKNRKTFISQLANNVKSVLREFEDVTVSAQRDRLHINLNGSDSDEVMNRLSLVFGIETYSPVMRLEKDASIKEIQTMANQMIIDEMDGETSFKVTTKRQNKDFNLSTYELNDAIGSYLLDKNDSLKVNLKNPDINLRIEVRMSGIYLSSKTIQGALGLPVGTGGRATMMLSGGIDSPVAAYMAMKRGVKLDMVHFYSPPYTSEQALANAKDLASKLASFGSSINFIQVPFTEIQEEVKAKVPEGYLMTIQRRFMLKITSELTKKRNDTGIFTGESLGQVASQTMESMMAINDVTTLPVLRPLLSLDKTEIIKIAKKIDTYELSIMPFEDCCTIFTPPSPKTKPDLEKTRYFEKNVDVDAMVQKAVDNIEVTKVKADEHYLNSQEDVFSELL